MRDLGIDPGDPAGDVSAWQWEDALYLRANTEKGAALLAGLPLEEGEESAVAAAQERTRSILNRLPLRELTTEGFGREGGDAELFHRPEWDQLSESCPLRSLHLRLPHLPVLDIKGVYRKSGDSSLPVLGQLHVFRLYHHVCRSALAHPKGAVSPAVFGISPAFPVNQGDFLAAWAAAESSRQCPIHMNIVKVMKTLGGAPHES